ncbi:hypothetical protein BCR33DRAFT_477573 [Rhizoclosmatium globosum]|uniref:Uncharacterized protein n=1 Tax=Rhizoclosmatium globosum TaxID=329046 RepID=A0A1Y2BQQ5_9FUNG|nr:hypothetical protein BCR33DRAFT_477573 [Rhizoclosmatium globosum]|eukprot:ORY36485.1 hypothetical protein BCR33DRAFT_477573 [Rhizoclosmatium globosum]
MICGRRHILKTPSVRLGTAKAGELVRLLGNIESRSSTRKSKPRSSLDASMMTSSPRSRTDLTASMALSKIAAQERATTSALKRPGAGSSSRTKVVLNATNSPSTSTRETQSTSTTRTDKSTHSREGSEFGGATRAEKASSLTYGKEEADRIGAEILRSTSSLSSKYPSPQRVQPSAQSSAPLGPIITHRRISADNTGSHLTAHPKATCLSPSQKQLSNGFAAKEEKSVSRNNITTLTALTDIQTVLHTSSSSLLPKIGDASLTRRKK